LLVMHQGRQHSYGTPEEVLTPIMFQRIFNVCVLVQRHPENNSPLVVHV